MCVCVCVHACVHVCVYGEDICRKHSPEPALIGHMVEEGEGPAQSSVP